MKSEKIKNLEIIILPVGQMKANCYLLIDTKSQDCIVIDPGDDTEYIKTIVLHNNLLPKKIIVTHGHVDHVMAVWELCATWQIPFWASKKDEFLINNMSRSAQHWLGFDPGPIPVVNKDLGRQKEISFEKHFFKIIQTPGHTPGSVCLYLEKENIIFVGDLIFAGGGVGRTDFSYSNKNELDKSVEKILQLPPQTIFYPGHGESDTLENFSKQYLSPNR